MATILASGEVTGERLNHASVFSAVEPVLKSADLVFGHLKPIRADSDSLSPSANGGTTSAGVMAQSLRTAGFHAMCLAGSQCMDSGGHGLVATVKHSNAAGLVTFGAGEDLVQARKPAMFHAGGLRIALLGANSILPKGCAAEAARPGCRPLRAITYYESIANDEPGTPPQTRTFCCPEDLLSLCEDVRSAASSADVVIVSLHWGRLMVPNAIADYQSEAAHKLVDAGAHAVIGNYPQVLSGIELYRGRPIFYSLGVFASEQQRGGSVPMASQLSPGRVGASTPKMPMGNECATPSVTRVTGLAKLVPKSDGGIDASFLPVWIGDDGVPRLVTPDSPEYIMIVRTLNDANESVSNSVELREHGQALSICKKGSLASSRVSGGAHQ